VAFLFPRAARPAVYPYAFRLQNYAKFDIFPNGHDCSGHQSIYVNQKKRAGLIKVSGEICQKITTQLQF
jgi:hypothetical protein